MTLLLITVLIFAIYVFALLTVKSNPHSLSDSFYIFEKVKKGLGNVFTIWCFTISILVMIQMLDLSDGKWFQFIAFITAGSLAFVGAAPLFKSHEKMIHNVSAFICATGSLIWICLMGFILAPIALFMLLLLFLVISKKKNFVFFNEITFFISIFTVIYLNI